MGHLGFSWKHRTIRWFCGSDGALLWQAQPDGPIASVLPLGESVIFFGINSRRISAVRSNDGSYLWQPLQLPTGRNVVLAATNGTIGAGTGYWVHDEGVCGSTNFPPTAASVRGTDGTALWC
jgi:hypothetical protein